MLQELHIPLSKATIVYCDNVCAVYMTANPVHHRRTKHIEIDIHFVREKVALGEVWVLHVPSSHQFADIMTKSLLILVFTLIIPLYTHVVGGCNEYDIQGMLS